MAETVEKQNTPSGVQSPFDLKDTHPERAVKADPGQKAMEKDLEKALKQSFPASDPPAASQPTTAGDAKLKKTKEA